MEKWVENWLARCNFVLKKSPISRIIGIFGHFFAVCLGPVRPQIEPGDANAAGAASSFFSKQLKFSSLKKKSLGGVRKATP